ncbi:hypothetical protein RIF29_38691 [Crotalaria pallida]|uniref:Uncharacterized protein n=1 Tax=Crotalaria pallida TaxID=3830 RepID=A0AAN9E2U0_CROPI
MSYSLASGTFDCVLLGRYVYNFRSGIASRCYAHDIVFPQIWKGTSCRGHVVCSTVMFVSRLLFIPNIPEIMQFHRRMLLIGIRRSPPIVAYNGSRCSIENQLLGDFPPVSLGILKSLAKPGSFMHCYEYRFKIPIVAYDSTTTVTLLLLDHDARVLLKRSCFKLFPLPPDSVQCSKVINYPRLLSDFVGCHYTFKVEVSNVAPESSELQFFIIRVGQDIVNLKSIEPNPDPVTFVLLLSRANVPVFDFEIEKILTEYQCRSWMLDSYPYLSPVSISLSAASKFRCHPFGHLA